MRMNQVGVGGAGEMRRLSKFQLQQDDRSGNPLSPDTCAVMPRRAEGASGKAKAPEPRLDVFTKSHIRKYRNIRNL